MKRQYHTYIHIIICIYIGNVYAYICIWIMLRLHCDKSCPRSYTLNYVSPNQQICTWYLTKIKCLRILSLLKYLRQFARVARTRLKVSVFGWGFLSGRGWLTTPGARHDLPVALRNFAGKNSLFFL